MAASTSSHAGERSSPAGPGAQPCATGRKGARPNRIRRFAPWIGFAALLILAGLELGLDAWNRHQVPSRADWQAAARAVRAEHRPGDLIVVAPEWAAPLGRLVLGDRMTLDDLTRPDAATYPRIFELSIRGRHSPAVRGAHRRWRRSFGPITVSRYEQTPVRVTADFYALLPRAEVHAETGTRRLAPCPWDARTHRFRCPARWQDVRAVRAEIGYTPRRCVLAHPVDGQVRVIAYPALPLGKALVVYTGIKGYDPRYRARHAVWEFRQFQAGRLHPKRPPRPIMAAPVWLDISVDGHPLARVTHPLADEGWRRHVVPLPAGPSRGRVRFAVSTRFAWSKPFCFYARSESPGGSDAGHERGPWRRP